MQSAVLERKGCPIHYWVGGPEGRPWVVLLHGACVDHRSFEEQWPVLTRYYRVLTLDVRGHGLSRPMGAAFSIPLAVEDVLELGDMLGFNQAVYVGHSNGTYIAQELVFRHPERVTALVVADGTCITWQHSAFDNWLVRASNSLMALFPWETLKTSGLSFASRKPEVQAYMYDAYSMLTKAEFLALWKGITGCLHAEPGYQIPKPWLLVHGSDDRMGDIKKIAAQWAAQEPNCQYEVIPDAGHFAIRDNPQAFNQVLLSFLAKWAPVEGNR
jgi:pimeloyl-ACP methyl ester carboxylesterase